MAEILQRRYDVEIIGPMSGSSIWEPVQTVFPYVRVNGSSFPKFVPEAYKMAEKISGDVIYANKPLLTSFGIGLIKKHVSQKPLVLDIDDWEVPFALKYFGKRSILHPNCYWSALVHERLTALADEITVSNRFLRTKFGGTVVCHARDTEHLDPLKYDGRSLREEFGIAADKKVITFLGTPRPHKGLEDLIKAMAVLRDRCMVLMVIGLDESRDARAIRSMMEALLLKGQVLDLGIQPIHDVPKYLSPSDLVVIPQRRTSESVGQTPAKVFDAMAMAKPIVATSVSDLPEILDNCGWIVDPEDHFELARAIKEALDNSDKAHEFGQKARDKCLERYSYDAMEKVLTGIFDKY